MQVLKTVPWSYLHTKIRHSPKVEKLVQACLDNGATSYTNPALAAVISGDSKSTSNAIKLMRSRPGFVEVMTGMRSTAWYFIPEFYNYAKTKGNVYPHDFHPFAILQVPSVVSVEMHEITGEVGPSGLTTERTEIDPSVRTTAAFKAAMLNIEPPVKVVHPEIEVSRDERVLSLLDYADSKMLVPYGKIVVKDGDEVFRTFESLLKTLSSTRKSGTREAARDAWQDIAILATSMYQNHDRKLREHNVPSQPTP